MFKNVLVGVDGSPNGRDAIALATQLRGHDGRLTLAHVHRSELATTAATVHALEVVSLPPAAYGGMVPPVGEYIDGMLKEANGRLQELSGVDAHAVYGIPGEELAAFGDAVDILVVGSRGYGPVRRLVVGSTSNYLERHARCSLLVLPRTVGTAGAPGGSKPRAEMPAAAI
jgi:nucleotide-binding universal stress UspA family protein